jgi:hypothetical protein
MKNQLSVFALIAGLLFGAAVWAQESVPAPTYKEGDTWQINITRQGHTATTTERSEGLYEIVFGQGKPKVFELDRDKKIEVDTSPDSTGEDVLGLIGKNERRPDLRFPLSIGNKWTYDHRYSGGRASGSAQIR